LPIKTWSSSTGSYLNGRLDSVVWAKDWYKTPMESTRSSLAFYKGTTQQILVVSHRQDFLGKMVIHIHLRHSNRTNHVIEPIVIGLDGKFLLGIGTDWQRNDRSGSEKV
jgi:hypothetical protein